MNLDQNAKDAVQSLSEAINSAVEKSFAVRDAIELLRELGFEPVLTLKLEIGLQKMNGNPEEFAEDLELSLTDEDVRTLQRMKIRF
ncbi:MAG TPA: hypothetical protein VNB22_06970 [Pyrinomonadaceae bacterium]|nr:hypothetical protein [Pyrinomonadaceae bacterium]